MTRQHQYVQIIIEFPDLLTTLSPFMGDIK